MTEKYIDAESLVGLTVAGIAKVGDDRIELTTTTGRTFAFLHNQDCCETVAIHDIQGDLSALVGKVLSVARKELLDQWPDKWPADVVMPESLDSYTWTFVRLESADTKVCIRFLGQSNGYYGEGVDLEEIT